MKRILSALAAGLLLSTVAACSSSDEGTKKTTITVFAAASLKGTFTEIGKKFEAEHKGVTVKFNFAGSSDLVAQLQQGASADVLATADDATMKKSIDDDLVAVLDKLGTNTLEIATLPANPANVDSLDDLADPDVKVVVCAPEVPCGAAARDVEKAAGADIKPVSEEQSVTDVLGKVISGEADAGLVYVTDVKAAGDHVHGVPFPESAKAVNNYPIAVLSHGTHQATAGDFMDFVTGMTGQSILSSAGFGKR
ncbi:MAG: molybdate transport system substrate-binding protein [Nocardioidaceae bacterium]|jgi:molybdate transport system substrate-binding protein|nr:molybdate transport system substrate-binding protein [Nocardioidaceae bacterium]